MTVPLPKDTRVAAETFERGRIPGETKKGEQYCLIMSLCFSITAHVKPQEGLSTRSESEQDPVKLGVEVWGGSISQRCH